MTLRGAACQIREFPIDQVPVPLRTGVETIYPQAGDQPVNLFGGQDALLARRHHPHDVWTQTGCCFR